MAETSVPDPDGEDFCAFGTKKTCRPFLWQNGTMSALPTLGGNNGSASDINNRAEIAGAAETAVLEIGCPANAPMHVISPVIWEEGKAKALPTVHGDPDGVAFAINDRGPAVGNSGTCGGGIHAISWENGMASSLPDLGTFANAMGLNNQGQIVGTAGSSDGRTQYGVPWQNGTITSLGLLPGDFGGIASGINNRGKWWGATGTPGSTGPMPSSGRTA